MISLSFEAFTEINGQVKGVVLAQGLLYVCVYAEQRLWLPFNCVAFTRICILHDKSAYIFQRLAPVFSRVCSI